MASSLRLLEEEGVEGAETPFPVTELPVTARYGGRNRRFTPRIATRFLARRRTGEVFEGIDLSFGGMLCAATNPVWPGNTLSLELQLAGTDTSIPVQGRVVELVSYASRIAMRIRFDSIETAPRREIARWMAQAVGHARLG
ncbi:MAG: PilZ domain-containing protein [Myxococcota bacterium]